MRKPKLNLKAGDKINHLTILSFHHSDNRKRRHFLCQCDCGNQKVIQASLIISGNTKSCGCLHKTAMSKFKLPNNVGVIHQIIREYKRHARDRSLEFNLNEENFAKLIQQPCHYCGEPPANIKITKNCREGFAYNGIDRIDSTKGYTKDNVVSSCKDCNKGKLDKSSNDFLMWIKRVYDYNFVK